MNFLLLLFIICNIKLRDLKFAKDYIKIGPKIEKINFGLFCWCFIV